jgi:hypothetical protein
VRGFRIRGRAAYEADVAKHPVYHDGAARKTWEELCATARLAWTTEPASARKRASSARIALMRAEQ